MKAPPFAYLRPAELSQALDLINIYGTDARLLAGGQSLLSALNMRLAAPSVLIDINGLTELTGITLQQDRLVIGALTRHAEIERSPLIAQHVPLLALAMPHVAHPAVRNRGTIGGSLAFADPAAELPACCVALDAVMIISGRSGERRVRARDFFHGLYETALQPGEILVAVEFAIARPGERCAFRELARRQGDYAMVGAVALSIVDGGVLHDVHLAFFGVGDRPVLAAYAAAQLEEGIATAERIAAAQQVLVRDFSAQGDVYCSGAMRMHLARVLLGRVIHDLTRTDAGGVQA